MLSDIKLFFMKKTKVSIVAVAMLLALVGTFAANAKTKLTENCVINGVTQPIPQNCNSNRTFCCKGLTTGNNYYFAN